MKGLKIAGRVLLGILVGVILLLVLLHLLVTVFFFDYFNHSRGEFVIPGLDTAFVPQGFDHIEEAQRFLVSGYMADGTASRVYVCQEDGEAYSVRLLHQDGSAYAEHAGGICHNGEYVYVAGSGGVDVFSLTDVLAGRDARMLGKIETGYDMAYCSFYNGHLLAGDFYYPGTYETPASHRITTPAGDANTGLMTVFCMDPAAELGIDPAPVAALSTPGRVQGICFTDEDTLVLSTSYSIMPSQLTFYTVDTTRSTTVELLGAEIPVYYLDSANMADQVTLPPMSEGLVCKDGRIYVMCESASNKYIFGKLIRGYQVFSYEYEE